MASKMDEELAKTVDGLTDIRKWFAETGQTSIVGGVVAALAVDLVEEFLILDLEALDDLLAEMASLCQLIEDKVNRNENV